MIKQGDAVVVHGLRGRPSNRKLPAETRRQAVKLLKQPDWHVRPNIRQPAVGQTARDRSQRRDRAEVDDRSWTVAEQVATAGRGACLAASSKRLWRTGAVGHLGARLAGRKPMRYLVRMIDDATS
jgi:hypothetical protein